MKKITLSLVMITIAITVFAQAPQSFKYQAVARDNAGNVLVNQNVTFRFSILQGSASGTLIFSETHEAITNEFGLVNLEIGTGEPEIGPLAEIDWGTGEKFLEVELDPAGGYIFTSMGTTQLLSVPYSLYSEATGDTTRWRKSNDDLFYNNGNVGIGTNDPSSWAKLHVKGNLLVDDGNTVISHTDATESVFNLYNTVSDWELVAASDNNRFDIRKWGGDPALSISDNNNIGIGTETPDESALLEVNSNAKGFLLPRLTNEQRDSINNPAEGLVIYNETSKCLNFFAEGRWNEMDNKADIGETYGTVTNPITGKTWLDRNLGASRVALSITDIEAYGYLFQWGRAAEGHQLRNSLTEVGPVNSWIADEGTNLWDGKFLIYTGAQYDWLSPKNDALWSGTEAENNPCPSGFRIPTNAEWNQERLTWTSNDPQGAFESILKLTVGGYRQPQNGIIGFEGAYGHYWSSTVFDYFARELHILNTTVRMDYTSRARALSVRCIKD